MNITVKEISIHSITKIVKDINVTVKDDSSISKIIK